MESQICQDTGFIMGILVKAIQIIRFAIPILLIVLIIFDLFKIVAGSADDKAKKTAFDTIVKRVLYAVIIFLVPSIINFILVRIEPLSVDSNGNITGNSTSYLGCWNYYYNK